MFTLLLKLFQLRSNEHLLVGSHISILFTCNIYEHQPHHAYSLLLLNLNIATLLRCSGSSHCRIVLEIVPGHYVRHFDTTCWQIIKYLILALLLLQNAYCSREKHGPLHPLSTYSVPGYMDPEWLTYFPIEKTLPARKQHSQILPTLFGLLLFTPVPLWIF